MVVTLDVSKLSGCLNADAYCRVERRAYTVRREVCGSAGGGRRTTTVQAACRAGLNCRLRAGHGGGAHVEHAVHLRDVGGVEAQRLVERRRALPRVDGRACGARYADWQAGAADDHGASSVQEGYTVCHTCRAYGVGQGSTVDSGQGTGEERTANMLYMLVTLEVSKLSGWLNADAPCRE